jgi:hypothetical protein
VSFNGITSDFMLIDPLLCALTSTGRPRPFVNKRCSSHSKYNLPLMFCRNSAIRSLERRVSVDVCAQSSSSTVYGDRHRARKEPVQPAPCDALFFVFVVALTFLVRSSFALLGQAHPTLFFKASRFSSCWLATLSLHRGPYFDSE